METSSPTRPEVFRVVPIGEVRTAYILRSLRVATVLAPHPDLLLHRPVGEAEQHALLIGLVGDGLPPRRYEDVLGAPAESLLGYARAARPFHGYEHRRIGRAVSARLESLGQQLNEGAHGWHRVVAGRRACVAHLDAVAGVIVASFSELMERLACPGIGVVEDRRGCPARTVVDGEKVGAIAGARVTHRPDDGLLPFIMVVDEGRVEELD